MGAEMDKQSALEMYKERLRKAINTVPQRVNDGGVIATRAWMKQRTEAERVLKKRDVTVGELMSALSSVE